MSDPKQRAEILQQIAELGGLREGVASKVAHTTGVAEADVYGAGSFYHLLSDPDTKVRVCLGLTCQLFGAKELLRKAQEGGLPAQGCSCLAACDRAPAVMREREVLCEVTAQDIDEAGDDFHALKAGAHDDETAMWPGTVWPQGAKDGELAMDLCGAPRAPGSVFAQAQTLGANAVMMAIDESGLQGRGGAGFPAAFKWRAVHGQTPTPHYVVLNADEGEPGTFKDREVMLRRPDLVLEGLAIAATAVGAKEVYCYLRGEFAAPWLAMEAAIERAGGAYGDINFHLHSGHGAYICGEETALLEALEGKRGMPRLKPPFPTENGLWGKPTLIHNVETIACVPAIVERGGKWFSALGKTGPGTKLYCISGHVRKPGVYEMPLGVSLDELLDAAGGAVGTLHAFSPGGASSGFLPASESARPLDFKALAEAGSMLGSAGVVVLNDTVDLVWAVRQQLRFFEAESCGQCAPCRIGTRFLRERVDLFSSGNGQGGDALAQAAEVAWEMNEGSICGLGQAAPLPLVTTLKHFPSVFKSA